MLAIIIALSSGVSFAKGPTLKVVISGADISRPIEITDRGRLSAFNIWSGPGTGPQNGDEGFVANWSSAGLAPPAGLKRYQVSFYANHHTDGLDYVVTYVYDPTSRKGYIYLPGRGEAEYARNTFSIFHRVEGNWFVSRKAWDDLAVPLIQREAKSSK